jgi:hypothetical protein
MTVSKPKFVKLLRCSKSSASCMSYWFLIFFHIHKISAYSLSPNPVYIPFCYQNTKMLQQCCDCCFPNHQAHYPFTPLSAIHNLGISCYLVSCCSCTVSYWGEICYKFQLNLPRTSAGILLKTVYSHFQLLQCDTAAER